MDKLKKIILKILGIGKNKIRNYKNKHILKVRQLRKLSPDEFIIEYTKIEASYKFHVNILKYVFSVISLSLISSFGIGAYKVIWFYVNSYVKLSEEQREVTFITVVLTLGTLLILITFMFIVVFLYFKLIKEKERELAIFREIKEERKKSNE